MTVSSWLGRLIPSQKPRAGEPLSLNRRMLQLAWPSFIENLLQTMLGFVDLVFVGRLGPDAIAGVGLGNQFMYLLMVVFMGLSVGNTRPGPPGRSARKDKADAERIAKQSLVIGAVLSVLIAAIGMVFADPIIRVMGATQEVTAIGSGFLRIVSAFSIVIALMLIAGGTLRGAGDTRTPMLITGVINIINVVLDYALIFGNFGFPELGAIGSAVATTIARGIGAGLMVYALFRHGSALSFSLRRGWAIHRESIGRILNIGGPAAAEQIIFQLGFVTFSAIAVFLGTNDLAAQQVAFNISGFSSLPAQAFGVAAITLVGQSLGARDPARAEASAWHAIKSGVIWMSVMGVGFVVWRHWLVGLYTDDPTVQQLGEMCLTFIAVSQPLQAIAVVMASALRGAGDTRATLVITSVCVWGVRVALAYLLGIVFGLGLFGVWLGWMADFVVRAALIYLRFQNGQWKTIRL